MELREKLQKPFPKKAMQPYQKSKGSPKFTTIKQMYVVERLNECLDELGWSMEVIQHWREEDTAYVLLRTTFKNVIRDYIGSASFKFLHGDAYKSAQTDALTKAASTLGIGIDIFKGEVSLYQTEDNPHTSKFPSEHQTPPPKSKGLGKCPECKKHFLLVSKDGSKYYCPAFLEGDECKFRPKPYREGIFDEDVKI